MLLCHRQLHTQQLQLLQRSLLCYLCLFILYVKHKQYCYPFALSVCSSSKSRHTNEWVDTIVRKTLMLFNFDLNLWPQYVILFVIFTICKTMSLQQKIWFSCRACAIICLIQRNSCDLCPHIFTWLNSKHIPTRLLKLRARHCLILKPGTACNKMWLCRFKM